MTPFFLLGGDKSLPITPYQVDDEVLNFFCLLNDVIFYFKIQIGRAIAKSKQELKCKGDSGATQWCDFSFNR